MSTSLTLVHVPYMPDSPEITGLVYLSWVAYPAEGEGKKRQDFCEAAMAGAYKAADKHCPDHLRHWKRERIMPKVNRGLNMIARRRIPALWVLYRHAGVFKFWDNDLSVSGACDAITQFDARADYNPEKNSDDFEAVLPNSDLLEAPEKNVRRAYYESLPALAMTIGLPVFRVPSQGIKLHELLGSGDWVLTACERANEAAETIRHLKVYEGKRINIPKHHI